MTRCLKIYFTDGDSKTFTHHPIVNEYNIGKHLEKMMSLSNLIIEAEGRVYFFPTQNIKYITVDPSPEKLGNQIITGATLIESD